MFGQELVFVVGAKIGEGGKKIDSVKQSGQRFSGQRETKHGEEDTKIDRVAAVTVRSVGDETVSLR